MRDSAVSSIASSGTMNPPRLEESEDSLLVSLPSVMERVVSDPESLDPEVWGGAMDDVSLEAVRDPVDPTLLPTDTLSSLPDEMDGVPSSVSDGTYVGSVDPSEYSSGEGSVIRASVLLFILPRRALV